LIDRKEKEPHPVEKKTKERYVKKKPRKKNEIDTKKPTQGNRLTDKWNKYGLGEMR